MVKVLTIVLMLCLFLCKNVLLVSLALLGESGQ